MINITKTETPEGILYTFTEEQEVKKTNKDIFNEQKSERN